MVKLDKIYTRGGDLGESSLTDGTRRSKADARFAAIGAVDEANSMIGLARTHVSLATASSLDAMLGRIQNDLFDLGADLATPDGKDGDALRIAAVQVTRLEAEMDGMNHGLPALTSFILPGGYTLSAHLHVARAVTRRAERTMVMLATREAVNPQGLAYINRLSDHLFVMARLANDGGVADVLWVPGGNR